jgi:hypothetical protein
MNPSSALGKRRAADEEDGEYPVAKRTTTATVLHSASACSETSHSEEDASTDGDVESVEKLEKLAGAMRTIIEVCSDLSFLHAMFII